MPPKTPRQQAGTAAGRPHDVPAAVTRAVAHARGHRPGKGRGQLPMYRVHRPKVRKFTTGAALGVGHFNARTSTLIGSKSTATTDWYRNADGTYTRHVYAVPVNYQTSSGTWAPIDTQLTAVAGGGWRETANSVRASFAAQADAESLGSLVFGSGNNGPFGLSFGLAGAASSPGTASGSSVTYPAVLPDTDLVETTTAVGISESLILHTAQAPATWLFPLRLNGLTPVLKPDGSVALEDAAGTVEGTIPAGLAMDSSGHGKPGAITPVTYQIVTHDGRPALQASIPVSWLTSTDRVFPVTVDPSLNSTVTGSTTVLSNYDADFSGIAMLYAGTFDAAFQPAPSPTPPLSTPTAMPSPGSYGLDYCAPHYCAQSFLQFGNLSNLIAGDSVTAATLNVWDAYATNCTTPEPFWVDPIEKPWSVTGQKSWPGPQTGTEIGQSDTTAPAAACSNPTANPTVGGWMSVNLDPSDFNPSSAAGSSGSLYPGEPPAEQYGLALASSTQDDNQWKEFDSFNTPNAPYLSLTYTPLAAPQISAQYPPDNYNSPSLSPVLMASGTEAAGVTAPLKYDFTVYNSSGATVATSGWIAASQWTVPWSSSSTSSDLAWGQVYYWSVQAYNGTAYSPATPVSYFSTLVPQPVLTSGLSQNTDGPGFNAADGDYASTVTDAQVTTVGPALEIQRYYNSRDPRISGAFGAGWSSILDMGAVAGQVDASGNTHTVVVTYPDGEEVAYGVDAGGAFAPPPGRYAMISSPSGGGYTLTDKNDTNYNFAAVPPSGEPYTLGGVRIGPLTSISDAYGHKLTFTRNSAGEITQMTSASGRSLSFTWSTPTGAVYPHVATVSTNPVVPGNSSTALTWTYTYSRGSAEQRVLARRALHVLQLHHRFGLPGGGTGHQPALVLAPRRIVRDHRRQLRAGQRGRRRRHLLRGVTGPARPAARVARHLGRVQRHVLLPAAADRPGLGSERPVVRDVVQDDYGRRRAAVGPGLAGHRRTVRELHARAVHRLGRQAARRVLQRQRRPDHVVGRRRRRQVAPGADRRQREHPDAVPGRRRRRFAVRDGRQHRPAVPVRRRRLSRRHLARRAVLQHHELRRDRVRTSTATSPTWRSGIRS